MKSRMFGWNKEEVLKYIIEVKEKQQLQLAETNKLVRDLVDQSEHLKAELADFQPALAAVQAKRPALAGMDKIIQELIGEINADTSYKLAAIDNKAKAEVEEYRQLGRLVDEERTDVENQFEELVEDMKLAIAFTQKTLAGEVVGGTVFKAKTLRELRKQLNSEDKGMTSRLPHVEAGSVVESPVDEAINEVVEEETEPILDDAEAVPEKIITESLAAAAETEPVETAEQTVEIEMDAASIAEANFASQDIQSPVRSELDAKQLRFIVGNVAGADLFDENKQLIITRGETITRETALRAKAANRLVELVINMMPPGFEEES